MTHFERFERFRSRIFNFWIQKSSFLAFCTLWSNKTKVLYLILEPLSHDDFISLWGVHPPITKKSTKKVLNSEKNTKMQKRSWEREKSGKLRSKILEWKWTCEMKIGLLFLVLSARAEDRKINAGMWFQTAPYGFLFGPLWGNPREQ